MKTNYKVVLITFCMAISFQSFAISMASGGCFGENYMQGPPNTSNYQPYNTQRYNQGTQTPYRNNTSYNTGYNQNYRPSNNRNYYSRSSSSSSNTTGNVVTGGIVGGLLGNGIGYLTGASGNARTAWTVAGLLAGGAYGYNESQNDDRDEYIYIDDGSRGSDRYYENNRTTSGQRSPSTNTGQTVLFE
jgi:hypothetical protein